LFSATATVMITVRSPIIRIDIELWDAVKSP